MRRRWWSVALLQVEGDRDLAAADPDLGVRGEREVVAVGEKGEVALHRPGELLDVGRRDPEAASVAREVDLARALRVGVAAVREGEQASGYPAIEIVSGAAHDAVYVARVEPTAMIFVPCREGISHNELEDAEPEHLAAGCNVLLHAMLSRAGV